MVSIYYFIDKRLNVQKIKIVFYEKKKTVRVITVQISINFDINLRILYY